MSDDDIRLPLLKRLAEQAMTDGAFRAVARDDLSAALEQFGYDLNPRERDMVMRFRDALAEAGVDLTLTDEIDLDAMFDDSMPSDLENLIEQFEAGRQQDPST